MAKLKAPLLSMGASGQLGKTLVYFPWKGIKAVRTYVVPSNPQSDAQMDQRGYLGDAVAKIHVAVADATYPLNSLDKSAYSLLASVLGIIMTWFNSAIKAWVDSVKVGNDGIIYHGAVVTPGDTEADLQIQQAASVAATAGDFWYGTSKSALLQSEVAVIVANDITATLTGLTNNTTYYVQFRPTAGAGAIGMNSGIYHVRPTA